MIFSHGLHGSSVKIRGFLSDSLKVVVEHAGMANQTHLFGQLHTGRPYRRTTPGTDDAVGRLHITLVLRLDTFTQCNLPD